MKNNKEILINSKNQSYVYIDETKKDIHISYPVMYVEHSIITNKIEKHQKYTAIIKRIENQINTLKRCKALYISESQAKLF